MFELVLNVRLSEHSVNGCSRLCGHNFKTIDRPFSSLLTHLHLQGATTFHGSSHSIVGYAAVDAIITVFHTQDGEELTVLPDAVAGVKQPGGHEAK